MKTSFQNDTPPFATRIAFLPLAWEMPHKNFDDNKKKHDDKPKCDYMVSCYLKAVQ